MGFFDQLVWGVQIWIWLSAFGSFAFFIVAYLMAIGGWEIIKGTWYRIRFPEKVIKIIIHYKSGLYKVFWRLEPSKDLFLIDKKPYIYDREQIQKEDEFYIKKQKSKDDKPIFLVVKNVLSKKINGKDVFKIGETESYNLEQAYKIKQKGKKWQELHYIYNVPTPLCFDYENGKLDFTGDTLKELLKNNLFVQLLKLGQQKQLIMVLIAITIITLLVSVFTLSKLMGWV